MKRIYVSKKGTMIAFWDVEVPTYETCDGPFELDSAIKKFKVVPIAWHDRVVGSVGDVIDAFQTARILPLRATYVEVSPELAERGVKLGTESKKKRKARVATNPDVGGLFSPEHVAPCRKYNE